MQIELRKQYKGVEITIIGNEKEDVVQKLADVITKVDYDSKEQPSLALESSQQLAPSSSPSSLTQVVGLEEGGPKILSPLYNIIKADTYRETQAKAFMVLGYVLKTQYSESELTSNRITPLMKDSGIDQRNIQNTTNFLAKQLLISKSKGKKSFTITARGEEYAKKLIDEARAALGGE